MAKFFALATLVVMGVIVADIIVHPNSTAAANAVGTNFVKPSLNALLGQTS